MRLLVVEHDGARLRGLVVERAGDRVGSRAAAVVDGGLESLSQLVKDLPDAPREAILLSSEVTAACVEAPPTVDLPAARLEGLVRWELESYAPDAEGGLVFAWAQPAAAAGPLLAAAASRASRQAWDAAFAAAGLRLRGIYPRLSSAPALLSAWEEPTILVEVADGRIGCSRVEAERVVRFRSLVGGDSLETILELEEPGARVVLVGSLPPELALAPELMSLPRLAEEELSVSAVGAARHAWGLPGGERVTALAARDPRPPLRSRPQVKAALAVAVVLSVVVALELWVGRALGNAEVRVLGLRDQAAQLERAAGARQALERELQALDVDEQTVRRREAVLQACVQRQAFLPALLAAVAAATPSEVAIDALGEEAGQRVRVRGFALNELAVRELQRDLATRLSALGLAPVESRVRRRRGRLGVEGYGFDLCFGPGGGNG
jgi:hypothetical protein